MKQAHTATQSHNSNTITQADNSTALFCFQKKKKWAQTLATMAFASSHLPLSVPFALIFVSLVVFNGMVACLHRHGG